MTEGFHGPPNVVDQLCAAIYQRMARADDRKMGLGVLAAVLERVKQLGIDARQAGQALGIDLVGLALVRVDEPRLARVGHKDLVAALL